MLGRPRKEFNKDQFEKLCHIQATGEEICGWFGYGDQDTLNARCKENYGMTYSDTYKIYSKDGRISLRRKQFDLATRSAGMAIFLGKQYLGQKDDALIDQSQHTHFVFDYGDVDESKVRLAQGSKTGMGFQSEVEGTGGREEIRENLTGDPRADEEGPSEKEG